MSDKDKEIKRLKRRVMKLEDVLKEEDSREFNDVLCESSIFVADEDGCFRRQVLSNLGDDYVIFDIEDVPNLDQINRSVMGTIHRQDSLSRYTKIKKGFYDIEGVYGMGKYIAGIGGLVIWLL